MKLTTSPLIWDLDTSGNVAPTVTPSGSVQSLTFNISNMEGRIDDMWAQIQALWFRYTFTLTQGASATVLNYDKLFQAVDSISLYSPILGDVCAQRSNQGGAVGNLDQVVGAGYKYPTPIPNQLASTAQDNTVDLYFRVPFSLDVLARPQDGGIWAPLFEKGKFIVNVATTAAGFPQANANVKAAAATVRAAFEVLPSATAQIHAPGKFVRYEMNTSGTQLKLFSFGNGDGFLGVNPGARLSQLYWMSSNAGMGGVDTIDKWTRLALQWRKQRVTNNPEFLMASFLAAAKRTPVVGSAGATVTDISGWPYTMAAGPQNGLLASSGLFLPMVWPGSHSNISGMQKQVGDLQIDAGFSSNPNGTHVFRTYEHYSWQPAMTAKLMGLMGFDSKGYTAEPKTEDNSDPRDIDPRQLWGVPLRVVPRSQARLPVI